MFRRRWGWFGRLRSDEGFTLAYGHRSITYADERGACQFGFEDGFLFPEPQRISGQQCHMDAKELEIVLARVMDGIRSEGHYVELYTQRSNNRELTTENPQS